ncbi:helix-turn-helix transcriptional regulator [Gordonia sp. GONU]|uniref:winged helix-turn-helix transcriptional regulator n=1 Tax=Gordonia sp. GONU TaxID=2972949 RepID=UPI0021AD3758|nr:helix-turn-helix domain-containing protein [Gordonia sp. GONU]MCR8896833.1 helix-turn-helix transcriptional regulator [Gordonia sp. GONU]
MSAAPEYCPVSIGVNLLADRWSLLIVREVMVGSHNFNTILRGLPGLSRSVLASRLRQLQRLGVIAQVQSPTGLSHEYRLTEAGEDLLPVIEAIGGWTVKWWFPEPRPDQVDNAMLLWRMRSGVRPRHLPEGRTTIRFDFTDGNVRRGWLVLTGTEASVCLHDPGYDVTVTVTGSGTTWHEVWYGHRTLDDALTTGAITLDGVRSVTRAFPKWFALSMFASTVAENAEKRELPSA